MPAPAADLHNTHTVAASFVLVLLELARPHRSLPIASANHASAAPATSWTSVSVSRRCPSSHHHDVRISRKLPCRPVGLASHHYTAVRVQPTTLDTDTDTPARPTATR